ncbi:hypothetical protein [Zobellia galactanivorans]|uniref:Conserved hypothetical membrane protein n=1 Tax=Zobellia galactanivorans (strain DSM 12802 / CCUG 47099 / CIP 106680 / NCIMB 13871 / Dsij) TaxID=63186 RepID=G0LAA0_ZOBGA|nr:hypothetical protein [Zobellia galactanivorans]CAZ95168.1 Conserved hypothetical membrane protein [Zobellia galactanivorans]
MKIFKKNIESRVIDNSIEGSIPKDIKTGIWLYFILLIFEGALRKWFLPSLSDPLLVVRDPVAIWIIYNAWKFNLVNRNYFIISMTAFTILGVITALLFGHGNIWVALFGARITLIHFPLIIIMGKVLNKNDIYRFGKFIMWLSIPMLLLIAAQFYSPQSAWVNLGVGGDTEGAGFTGAMGYFRPPGTFSFQVGNTLFFSLVGVFVVYFWTSKSKLSPIILSLATIALLASIPLSISRTLFYSICLTIVFYLCSIIFEPKRITNIIFIAAGSILILLGLMQFEAIDTAVTVFINRLETASDIEGGVSNSLFDRIFGYMFRAYTSSNEIPFWGYGLGMGTNVGSQILSGKRQFLVAEFEWNRIVAEMGVFLGTALILVRVALASKLVFGSLAKMKKGELLPWLLLSVGLINLLQSQWWQPTILGFGIFINGLAYAAVQTKEEN